MPYEEDLPWTKRAIIDKRMRAWQRWLDLCQPPQRRGVGVIRGLIARRRQKPPFPPVQHFGKHCTVRVERDSRTARANPKREERFSIVLKLWPDVVLGKVCPLAFFILVVPEMVPLGMQ